MVNDYKCIRSSWLLRRESHSLGLPTYGACSARVIRLYKIYALFARETQLSLCGDRCRGSATARVRPVAGGPQRQLCTAPAHTGRHGAGCAHRVFRQKCVVSAVRAVSLHRCNRRFATAALCARFIKQNSGNIFSRRSAIAHARSSTCHVSRFASCRRGP